ncbi:hypothetical protein AZE42_13399 [Rhizopogon vesiculosus]|uniref:Uncharacterized protein n=1 Tax=Rhizopogon vesiculosus TaxID=180088 RepID=A0A1J8PU72_9AGAM|nr:hypothetical protein AZE42_13399 [Rhizopogon vesiculosus]
MKHYPILIRLFGAPNGLCSSITETKHIKAVKEPWRRSSRYKALGQMLVTNQRLDKIAAARRDFNNRGMLQGTCLLQARIDLQVGQDRDIDLSQDAANANVTEFNLDDIEIDDGPTRVDAYVLLAKTKQRKRAHTVPALADELSLPHLQELIRSFLIGQHLPNDARDPSTIPITTFPYYDGKVSVFNSASSRFYAPSDISGIHVGMTVCLLM